jgi:hypothetical protein
MNLFDLERANFRNAQFIYVGQAGSRDPAASSDADMVDAEVIFATKFMETQLRSDASMKLHVKKTNSEILDHLCLEIITITSSFQKFSKIYVSKIAKFPSHVPLMSVTQ